MDLELLSILRCPFCGTRLSLVENDALARDGDRIDSGVLGCECCAFPIVDGIPVLLADEVTRDAMHALEAGRHEDALVSLLGLEGDRCEAFRSLITPGTSATYRAAIEILSPDAEGTYFVYRFSDPTYLMAQAIVQAIGQQRWPLASRVLDVCGGSGHLTRALSEMTPADGTVLADLFFWKLWLASHFTTPGCVPICCDANQPMPFARDAFSMVVLSDAFPYIWHKRMLAEEMMRLAGPGGVVVMPHLHSSLGENVSAGMPLTPNAYRDLFAPMAPRLFSDETLLDGVLDLGEVDLTADAAPADLDGEPSLTLVASARPDVFRRHIMPDVDEVRGVLVVNPLYRVDWRGHESVLTLTFPTEEYAEEFGACRRYLPDTLTVRADVRGTITPESIGSAYAGLRRRHVLLDLPARYV